MYLHTHMDKCIYTNLHTYVYWENWTRPTVVKHFKDGIPGIFYILPMPESSVTNQRLI